MSQTLFKHNEIVLLLGAGASVEAGIPDSQAMIGKLERLLKDSDEWQQFAGLYQYIKSAVHYADGLDGKFGGDVPFNIERLVNVLSELHKRERHTLYPFVGAWNPKLLDVAGDGFRHVQRFRSKIIERLRKRWIALSRREDASYYTGLLRFQKQYGYPLRVFSLNYDLCVERTCGRDKVQMGFSGRRWDWRLFDEASEDSLPVYLYKLHGSTDWRVVEGGSVTWSDSASTIGDDDVALIFASEYKLQYVDPFLFCAYELRRWTLDTARLIVTVGYGFGDRHINGILRQALHQGPLRRLLVVEGPQGDGANGDRVRRVCELLEVERDRVDVRTCGAKSFLGEGLTIESLAELFPTEVDPFPIHVTEGDDGG